MNAKMLRRSAVALALALPLLGHDPEHDRRWLEDLTALHTDLPRLHPNLFSKMTRRQFDDAAVALAAAIPQLSNPEIITRMAAMIALAGDAHTSLSLTQKPAEMARFPLQFRWFSDGLFITGATAEYRNAIGTRVLKIGGYETDAVFRQIKTLISHENDYWARQISRDYFASADALAALRVIPSAANATFEVITVTGTILNVAVASMPSASAPALEFDPASHGNPLPLYRQNAGRNYWWTYLETLQLLYMKYTVCRNDPERPFAQVAQEFLAAFDSQPVRKVVIDFRGNGGGDSSVINPLFEGLQQRQGRLQEGVLLRGHDERRKFLGPETLCLRGGRTDRRQAGALRQCFFAHPSQLPSRDQLFHALLRFAPEGGSRDAGHAGAAQLGRLFRAA
jgi:hypothetical protein